MSYKVKSIVYLICFIFSVVIYSHMETKMDNPQNDEIQLVQTDNNELQQNDNSNL